MRQALGLILLLMMTRLAGAADLSCSLQAPRLSVTRPNIFTEQQEQWLGDAQADMVEPRYTLLPATESTYLDTIAKRLLDQLPPASTHYAVRVFESPDLRAFSLAGGHIYISRKLIMDARNEDELAAMLAQEIGRVYIHHSASVVTLRLDKLLHVRKVGDQADVYDKFERMLDMPPTDDSQLSPGDQKKDELQADQVGLYAMIKANYDPRAFAVFLDRINNNGGFTGNLFTDLFDITPEISIRVKMAHKSVNSLPAGCRQARHDYRPGFKPFQEALGSQRIDPIVPATAGLTSSALQPAMEPALENVALSRDGKYVLAQDEYKIHVLSTSPLKLLFSVDALGAELAQFSPDSKYLVFNYNDLHLEKWDLATGHLADALDFVDYAGCVQTSLSPDGNVMACVSYYGGPVWLKLFEVHSGRMLYQNMHFFDRSTGLIGAPGRLNSNFQVLMRWTSDGRYFVGASGTSAMAYDLLRHLTVPLQKSLSDLSQERFAFVGSDRLVSTCDWDFKSGKAGETFRMCYTTFPDGKNLGTFDLPRGWLTGVTHGDWLLFGPVPGGAAALIEPAKGSVGEEFRQETVDVAGNELAAESPIGGISVGPLGGKPEELTLPVTPLAALESEAFSMNGRYLAISDRLRGAEWDLSTGKLMAITPPARAVAVQNDGKLQAQFIRHELNPSTDVTIDKRTHKYSSVLTALADPVQYGSVRLKIVPRTMQQLVDFNVDLEAIDAVTEARRWTIHFETYLPVIVPADGDKLLLVTSKNSLAGNTEASRNRRELIKTSDWNRGFLDDRGTLVEIVSSQTGKVERAIASPQLSSTSDEQRNTRLFGNLLAVYGNHNNTVVYHAADGTRLLAFFGRALAGSDTLGMVAATNRPQELSVYDTASGNRLLSVMLDHNVLAARFVPAEKRLLVLTATQHLYRLDLAKLIATH